ncbi:transmembrane protein 268 [Eurytemora carolleeae]|uniref:transmembrane protein 268 n=1 Tax=Eurytemora carolleeae TaxID=1294199 RepID=UPI000C7790B9|nr:transmembrane protein 268 [Eurytemora carolleeae]|eukprot:XP_023339421.1 transmembrane protein 268-like [Eurytemora affinis]
MEEVQSVRGKGWVKFDEEDGAQTSQSDSTDNNQTPGSLEVTDSHSVDVESLRKKSIESPTKPTLSSQPAPISAPLTQVNLGTHPEQQRQFDSGEVLVTLLPVNDRLPWITPARFRPELVPEELMAPSLTLTVEDYVNNLEKLTTDIRFTLYNIFYKRILVIWIVSAFLILLGILFGNKQPGLVLFGLGIAWLVLNAAAIFLCMWVKLKLNKSLEKCMARVNGGLIKHKLLLGLDDRGKLSCHKVNLCFMYLDASPCITYLEKLLDNKPDDRAENGVVFDREAYLRDVEGFDDTEIVVSGRNSVRVGGKTERAEKLFLHYSQRWAKEYLRRRLDWMVEDLYGRQDYSSNNNPRHIRTALCPCQFIEEHLKNKRHRDSMNPCHWKGNPCQWCD